MLYTKYNNTIRWILERCTKKDCVNKHIPGKCNNSTQPTNLIQFNLI